MNKILNFLSILGLTGLCIKMGMKNELSVEKIGVVLVGAVFIFARRDDLYSKLFKTAIALLSIGYLLVDYVYSTKEFLVLIACVGALLLALFGLFIMFGGLRKK